MQEEFYAVAFRKKIYNTLDELQMTSISDWKNIIMNTLIPANTATEVRLCKVQESLSLAKQKKLKDICILCNGKNFH